MGAREEKGQQGGGWVSEREECVPEGGYQRGEGTTGEVGGNNWRGMGTREGRGMGTREGRGVGTREGRGMGTREGRGWVTERGGDNREGGGGRGGHHPRERM